ncbi:glycosyltransferase [Jiulongibacter sp. NS-SX5]|uniref:glycosyltransferase n=1 Tax=Jiulongibacter sp. NS-SX5 TaxID=3463854 RepID=UPI00405A1E6B
MIHSASVVLYKNDVKMIVDVIECYFQSSIKGMLFLVDNSPTNQLERLKELNKNIEYIHFPHNPGFGAGHNYVLKRVKGFSDYHFIINPDITFDSRVIEELLKYGQSESDVGLVMPKIVYPDGTTQYLAKLLPSPFTLVLRRIEVLKLLFSKHLNDYELRLDKIDILDCIPFLSGCFLMVNMSNCDDDLLFDEKFFMYFEDVDLSRRFSEKGLKTIYYGRVYVTHDHEVKTLFKFSNMSMYLKSAIYYFNKWGWFFDKRKSAINSAVLRRLRNMESITI